MAKAPREGRLRLLSGELGREGAANAEAAPRAAVGLDVAPCGDHDVLDDCKAEPGPAGCARRVCPVEALEEPRQVFLRHALPVVDSGQHRESARAPDREGETGTVAGVADCVLGEV